MVNPVLIQRRAECFAIGALILLSMAIVMMPVIMLLPLLYFCLVWQRLKQQLLTLGVHRVLSLWSLLGLAIENECALHLILLG